MANFYKWQTRKRLPSDQPLPLLPKTPSQKSFAAHYRIKKNVRRLYLDARAQYAGYPSYEAWLRERRGKGIAKKNTARSIPSKTFKASNGKAYIFRFWKMAGKHSHLPLDEAWQRGLISMPDELYDKMEFAMDKLLREHPSRNWVVQAHVQGNRYGGAIYEIPPKWEWVSTLPMSVDGGPLSAMGFMKQYGTFLSFLRDSFEIVDWEGETEAQKRKDKNGRLYTVKGKDVSNRGVFEVHLTFYKV